jgi:hypothetical protein
MHFTHALYRKAYKNHVATTAPLFMTLLLDCLKITVQFAILSPAKDRVGIRRVTSDRTFR